MKSSLARILPSNLNICTIIARLLESDYLIQIEMLFHVTQPKADYESGLRIMRAYEEWKRSAQNTINTGVKMLEVTQFAYVSRWQTKHGFASITS
ncbi:hypothetical protein MAR_026138 [Mya arenaria]|uniref:Uncharacterized protein n=1 Tax=Mya arenaria TaxID=6604 RepID=A0ABY7EPQ7_MYAAR|nr:hypothetical protein MAR_026138 [Mya arenaria]